MKKQLIFNLMVILAFILFNETIFSQGAKIAKELNDYIKAPAKTGFKPIGKATEKEKKTYFIGGQQVQETNSVIYKAFKMNPTWTEMTVVADWTGSMYQYIGQVMRWHKRNITKKLLKNLILFNDGDDNIRQTNQKVIGNTGGIYYTNPNNMDDFLKKVENAVDNGDGGDAEENDIEALIKAQKMYPDSKELILIADNTSIRDIKLVEKINKPVHVLLCNSGWVYDYVLLAYKTKGSIITPTDNVDFSSISQIDPNNIILDGVKYKIK